MITDFWCSVPALLSPRCKRVVFVMQWRVWGLRVGLGIALLGASVAAELPDQLAVMVKVEHRQALDGPQDEDLVAPEVGA